jgi:hypothetical protein
MCTDHRYELHRVQGTMVHRARWYSGYVLVHRARWYSGYVLVHRARWYSGYALVHGARWYSRHVFVHRARWYTGYASVLRARFWCTGHVGDKCTGHIRDECTGHYENESASEKYTKHLRLDSEISTGAMSTLIRCGLVLERGVGAVEDCHISDCRRRACEKAPV